MAREIAWNEDTQTAYRLVTRDGKQEWVETDAARTEDGAIIAFDGKDWQPVGVAPPSTIGQGVRTAEMVARGITDQASSYLSAPGRALNALGVPNTGVTVGDAYDAAAEFAGVDPIRGANRLAQSGLESLGINLGGSQETQGDRIARRVGEGVTDAVAFALPAARIAKYAAPGTVTQGAAQTLATAPAMQSVASGTGGGVAETTGSELAGFAASMATPFAAAAGARAISKAPLDPAIQRLQDVAAANNIPLTPAQKSDSGTMRRIEDAFSNLPITASVSAGSRARQATAYNRAVLKQAGINGDKADAATLSRAADDLGKEVEELADALVVTVDDQFIKMIANIEAEAVEAVSPFAISMLNKVVNAVATGVPLSGKEWQKIGSDIRQRTRNVPSEAASNADRREHEYLSNLLQEWDDLAVRSAGVDIRPAWQSWRNRYKNFAIIREAAMKDRKTDNFVGNINPTKLDDAVKKRRGLGYVMKPIGEDPMRDLGKVGTNYVRQNMADSGTAQRAFFMDLMSNPRNLVTGGGVGGIAALDPSAAAWTAGGLALPPILQQMYRAGAPLVQGARSLQGPRLNKGLFSSIGNAQAAGQLIDE
jgi:hypothetical protein